jgi:hypothetical protein
MKPATGAFLVGLMLASRCLGSNDDRPPVGSYGFDSLKPATTKCAKLDAAKIAKLSSCTFAKNNSFGDDREGWACHVGKHSGFMAYRTQADCKTELELERANGD